jgi:hypothetical protein
MICNGNICWTKTNACTNTYNTYSHQAHSTKGSQKYMELNWHIWGTGIKPVWVQNTSYTIKKWYIRCSGSKQA